MGDMTGTKARHTPGPWDNFGGQIWQYWDGRKVCLMSGESLDPEENIANMNLVKAAPDMLAALEAMVAEMDTPDLQCGWHRLLCRHAHAAIAKAKGGE